MDSHTLGHYPPAKITQGPNTEQLGIILQPRAHQNYSNYPTLSLLISLLALPCPFLPEKNKTKHNKGSYPQFPSAYSTMVLLCIALTGHGMLPATREL